MQLLVDPTVNVPPQSALTYSLHVFQEPYETCWVVFLHSRSHSLELLHGLRQLTVL